MSPRRSRTSDCTGCRSMIRRARQPSLRILMLEDVPSDAELMKRELRRAQISLVAQRVETRETFLLALEEFLPEVILVDCVLRQFDGMTALLLTRERCPHVPVIIVTDSTNEVIALECIKAGAVDYVLKTHLARLVPAIERALEQMLEREARERAEQALKESEERFRSVVESASVAIVIVDAHDRIRFWNLAAEATFGYAKAQVVGKPLTILMPERFRDAHQKRLKRFLATGESRALGSVVEVVGLRKDGAELSLEISLSEWKRGETECFSGIIRDITERKRVEEALRRSEAKFRTLVENAVYGVFRSSPDGKFLSVNPALVELLGYESEEEVLALDLSGDVYVDPGERARLLEEHKGGRRIDGLEVQWKRKDAKPITVRLGGRPVLDEHGELAYLEMIAEDVTERQALEAQLRQAQKLEALGRLAGGVAHDFNNLLTVVLGESEIALADLPLDYPVRDGLQEIHKAGERAVAFTQQLLAFSRRQVAEPVVFNLNEIVTDLDKMLRRLIGEDIELITRTAADTGAVRADRGQIEQVVMNLVVNARDAMPQGGQLAIETVNVTLDESYARSHVEVVAGDYVQISVSDSGPGMTQEVKARLFEPFFTTKQRASGLGLAMCYGIVKQFGGHIGVYSEPGIGTTMRVYLPRVTESVEGTAEGGPAAGAAGE